MVTVRRSTLHPFTNRAGSKPCVTRDLTKPPALTDKADGLYEEAKKMRIGGVGHVRHYACGCCEAIEPLQAVDNN